MSSEEPNSHLNSNKSLKYYFTKTTNFVDENLRLIQYTLYGTAAIGVVLSLRSLKLFSKFNRIEDIPDEFILKQIKLRGIVNDVKHFKKSQFQNATKEYKKYTYKAISYFYAIPVEVKENEWMKNLKEKLLLFSKGKSAVVKNSPELGDIYLHVSHLPIIQRKTTEEHNLIIRLASIQVTQDGAKHIKDVLQGKKIWFVPLKISKEKEDKVLDCIVRPTGSYFGNYSNFLVKNQWALVEPFDLTLNDNKTYQKYHKKLMKIEERQEKIIVILLKIIRNFLFRK